MKNRLFFSAMLVSLLAFGLTLTSCAPSAAQQAIMSATSVEDVPGLNNKLTWLQNNAQSGGNYIIEITSNEIISTGINPFASYIGNLSYKDKSDITITIRGVTSRTISRDYNYPNGTAFAVGSGVTLILDNIKIQPGKNQSGPPRGGALVEISDGGTLVMNDGSTIAGAIYSGDGVPGTGEYASINSGGGVKISSGGTLVMNDGSTIIFNTNKSSLGSCNGGGVSVSSGGTFIMKGGIITSNTSFPIPDMALTAASGGKATNYTNVNCKGGGVYVSGKSSLFGKESPSGTFTKTGGTITGYASDLERGNQVMGFNGNGAVSNMGHAIYFGGKEGKSIDATVGPEMSFNFSNDKFSEILNEEPTPPDVPTEIQTEDAP